MKIVQVINAMIANGSKITNVIQNKSEYFFIYDKKHKWSILKQDNQAEYFLHFYPINELDIDQLAKIDLWQDLNYVTFKSSEIKTQEAIESFSELYQIVAAKVFGLDDIFNEIINS